MNSLYQVLKIRKSQRANKEVRESTLFSPHYVVVAVSDDAVAATTTSTAAQVVSKAAGPAITLGVSMWQAANSDEITFGDALAQNLGGMAVGALASAGVAALLGVTSLSLGPAILVAAVGAGIFNWAYNNVKEVKGITDFVADGIDSMVDNVGSWFGV